MRPVISLLARSTLEEIRASLQASGHARCRLDELRVDVTQWRSLARKAGRELGRSVQTIVDDYQVSARLLDWPANDDERAVTMALMRKTIQEMEAPPSPGGGGKPVQLLR